MKKLLLVISVFVSIGVALNSCRNTPKINATTTNKSDTINYQNHVNSTTDGAVTLPIHEVDSVTNSSKDTLAKPKKAAAIIHASPEQQKIDSIKNSKPKDKK